MQQSNTVSLSLVLPALLDPSAHQSEFPHAQGSSNRDLASLAPEMKADMDQCFRCFLDPRDLKFLPFITAACLLNPTVSAKALIENDGKEKEAVGTTDKVTQIKVYKVLLMPVGWGSCDVQEPESLRYSLQFFCDKSNLGWLVFFLWCE